MSRLVVMCVDALFTTDLEDAARMEALPPSWIMRESIKISNAYIQH